MFLCNEAHSNKGCRMTAKLDCDWLGNEHVFEFLAGMVEVGVG